jgi:hypothetical protein
MVVSFIELHGFYDQFQHFAFVIDLSSLYYNSTSLVGRPVTVLVDNLDNHVCQEKGNIKIGRKHGRKIKPELCQYS